MSEVRSFGDRRRREQVAEGPVEVEGVPGPVTLPPILLPPVQLPLELLLDEKHLRMVMDGIRDAAKEYALAGIRDALQEMQHAEVRGETPPDGDTGGPGES